jgi:hypothetical protein
MKIGMILCLFALINTGTTTVLLSQTSVPFSYGGTWGTTSMSSGNLTASNALSYNSGAEHRLDATGHWVKLNFVELTTGTFQVKLIAKTSSGAWSGTITLQSSTDGSNWTDLTPTITMIGNNGDNVTPSRTLSTGSKYARVYFTNKVSGSNLGVDDFSVDGTPLPVSLATFTATKSSSSTQLSWRTASELNNAHFSIERSADGREYKEIGVVQGHGTSLEPRSYTYTDESPAHGLNYYRLRQVDFDGQYEYSQVVSVQFSSGKESVQLFPTLVRQQVELRFGAPADSEGNVRIFNQSGREVQRVDFAPDTESLLIPVEALPGGQYFVRVQSGHMVQSLRFVK